MNLSKMSDEISFNTANEAERAELSEKIDQLILSGQEDNILLALHILQGLGKPSASHFNMYLAVMEYFKTGEIVQLAEESIREYYDLNSWKEARIYQFELEDKIRETRKIPFYDYFYYTIWLTVFQHQKNSYSPSIELIFRKSRIIPPEICYLKNINNFKIELKLSIDLREALKYIPNLELFGSLFITCKGMRGMRINPNFLKKVNTKNLVLENIILFSED